MAYFFNSKASHILVILVTCKILKQLKNIAALRVKEKDLTCNHLDGGGVPIYIYYHNGRPFTGVVLRYYDTGELFCEEEYEEYKDGYQEG